MEHVCEVCEVCEMCEGGGGIKNHLNHPQK